MKRIVIFVLLICLFTNIKLYAQHIVKGTVFSADDDNPLIGVNIIISGTNDGTITNLEGMYSLEVPKGKSLEFSFIGYLSQTIDVENKTALNVTLEVDAIDVDEIIVTALGVKRQEKALGYSITQVNGEEFTEAREINFVNALSGKVAGVNVSNLATGSAGSSRVIIRGSTSLTGNNQPLYVVDGIPIDNTNQGNAGKYGGQDWGDGISSLNPDDIETMSVLKGNTAAALYGSRASNGVIIITSKRGTKRKGIGVEFNSNYTFDKVIDYTDWQDAYGQGLKQLKPKTINEAIKNGEYSWGEKLDGSNVVQFNGVSRPYSAVQDNIKRFYETGKTFTNTLALSGGNDKHTARFSASNLDNNSIIPNSNLNRKTFSLATVSKFKNLTAEITAKYIIEDIENRPKISDTPGNLNYSVATLPVNLDVENLAPGYDNDGNEVNYQKNIYVENPYFVANKYETSDKKDRFIGSIFLKYNFTDWLYVSTRAGIDFYTFRQTNITPYGTSFKKLGDIAETEKRFREITYDAMIGVNKNLDFIGIHGFLGASTNKRNNELLGLNGVDYNIPFLYTVSNTANQTLSYIYNSRQTNSMFGSLELSYNEYLFLTFTGRNDWFSTLPTDKNNLFYPSVGLSFILSEALTLPKWLSFAKIRASIAQVSGDTDPYQLDLTYKLLGQGHLGNPIARIAQSAIPNSELEPLMSTEKEIGFDIRLFNGKLAIDFAYYTRKSENDILKAEISQTTGFKNALVNVGEVQNNGIELLLSGTPIKTRNFSWETIFNIAKNNSEVKALTHGLTTLRQESSRDGLGYIHHEIGEQYSVIEGYKYKKDDTGQIVYDAEGLPLQGEFKVLGNGVHDLTMGLINTFRYKSISLSFLIDMKSGGSIYSATNRYGYYLGLHKNTLDGRVNGITGEGVNEAGEVNNVTIAPENLELYYQRIANKISEEFVQDASFIKLRQLTLSYRLPYRLVNKTPFAGISVSFVVRNLWLIWTKTKNVDPEAMYNNNNGQGLEMFGVPSTRNFGFNLNIKF